MARTRMLGLPPARLLTRSDCSGDSGHYLHLIAFSPRRWHAQKVLPKRSSGLILSPGAVKEPMVMHRTDTGLIWCSPGARGDLWGDQKLQPPVPVPVPLVPVPVPTAGSGAFVWPLCVEPGPS